MGLFGFLRRKDEKAIPEPGTPEFEEAVQGSAIPDAQSVSMGQPGWSDPHEAVLLGELLAHLADPISGVRVLLTVRIDFLGRLAEAPIFIDDSPNITLMEMRAKCRRLKARHGLGLIMIDYLQLLQSPRRSENRQQEVSEPQQNGRAIIEPLAGGRFTQRINQFFQPAEIKPGCSGAQRES